MKKRHQHYRQPRYRRCPNRPLLFHHPRERKVLPPAHGHSLWLATAIAETAVPCVNILLIVCSDVDQVSAQQDWLAMHAAGAINPDELEGEGGVSYTDGRSVTASVVSSSSTAEPLPLPHGHSLISGHGQSVMSGHGHRSVISSSSERDGSRSHVSAGVGRSTVGGQSRAG